MINPIKISAVIITFNEERNIARCLASLEGIADEIIVVDSISTDKTESICKSFNTTFIKHAFEGHIQQKNWALGQASHDYIISLDADEAIDKRLKKSILEVKSNWKEDAYKMNRLTNYCGKWIRHGSWYPDTKLRLAKKDKVIWDGENPHDRLSLIDKSEVAHLQGDLLHYSYYSIEEHITQQEKFSSIAAEAMFKRGKKAPFFKLIVNPLASILKDLVFKLGFLDGKYGFIITKISAQSVYWKYSKLRRLWKGNSE